MIVKLLKSCILTCCFVSLMQSFGICSELENCYEKEGMEKRLEKMAKAEVKENALDNVVQLIDKIEDQYPDNWERDLTQFIQSHNTLLEVTGDSVKNLFPVCFCNLELFSISSRPKMYENMLRFFATFKIPFGNYKSFLGIQDTKLLKWTLDYYNLAIFCKDTKVKKAMHDLMTQHNIEEIDSFTNIPFHHTAIYMPAILMGKAWDHKEWVISLGLSYLTYTYFG